MNKILFHIAGIAIIEILFYFFYIGPMESKIFRDNFSTSFKSLFDNLDSNSPSNLLSNFTDFIYNYEQNNQYSPTLKNEAHDAEDERNDYNHDLLIKVTTYWLIVFIGITIIYIFYKFFKLKKEAENSRTNVSNVLVIHDIEDNNQEPEIVPAIDSNAKINSYYQLFFYFLLGGLILLFEYIFFQYIVLEYHVISKQELEYLIYQQFLSSFNSEISG